jgi:hypothetical protein
MMYLRPAIKETGAAAGASHDCAAMDIEFECLGGNSKKRECFVKMETDSGKVEKQRCTPAPRGVWLACVRSR